MRRLKAVMNPAVPAGRRSRLVAAGLAVTVAAVAGAGSLAVAGEREAVIRVRHAAEATTGPRPAERAIVGMEADQTVMLNGAPLPEGLPMWAIAPERVDIRTSPAGSGALNLILPFTGQTPVSVNGARMPDGFPASGVNPDAVAGVEIVGDHVMFTLKSEAEVRRARQSPDAPADDAARAAVRAAFSRLTPDQQARLRDPTAAEYRALCASSDPADEGFCAGVIFAQFPRGAAGDGDICLPSDLDGGDEASRRSALGALVGRTRAEIAGASIQPSDRPGDVARAALARAYPCGQAAAVEAFRSQAARMERDYIPLTVSVDVEGAPLSVQGDETLRVVLTDENGVVMNTHGTLGSSGGRASGPLGPLGMAIATADFPGPGETSRVYTLTGEIRGPGRVLRYVAEPVTLRLAPGARRADLRPTLSFRPA